MIRKSLKMTDYSKTGRFEETAKFRKMYDGLLEACEQEGTLVLENRVLEKDADIAPYRFVRRGITKYVFPKQEATELENDEQDRDRGTGYDLEFIKRRFLVDQSKVKGSVIVNYEDADNCPKFKVGTEAEIPVAVQERLAQIF